MEIKGIKYTGPILDSSGYAKACRGNILALYNAGVPITINPISFEDIRPELGEEGVLLNRLANRNIDYNVHIIHTTPEFWEKFKEDSVVNIGYTIWETTKLHPDWPPYINNNVTKVLVGCEWNKEVFKDSGVTVPIGVVPHGINVDEFSNIEPYNISSVSDDDYMFYSVLQWCYDEKTRVLTNDGFKYFKDLGYEDEIATLNKETEELEYYKPDEIVKFRRKDKMYSLNGDFFDVCVTPDHKMVVKEYKKDSYSVDSDEPWRLIPFNELLSKNKQDEVIVSSKYRTKKNCKWTGEEQKLFKIPLLKDTKCPINKNSPVEINMDIFLEFLGWYLSEGSTYKASNGYINTITQVKLSYREEIIKCINGMAFKVNGKGKKNIVFHSREMHYYLNQFGKASTKFIPKWIKKLSSRQILILLTSLFKGDGSLYENGDWVKYTTTSKQLAEDVQECLLKVGMSGAISTEDPTLKKPGKIEGREIRGKLLQYIVSVNRKRNEPSMYYANIKEIDYDGYVYCAKVKNHTMLVERNGKTLFSGNTERKHPTALIKAYFSAFTGVDDVALVLKTYRSDYSDREKDAIRTTIKRLKLIMPLDHYPKISYISDMLTDDEIAALHYRGDCYLSFDRGEGFGLSSFQAGANGNPIIVTGFGGVTEYAKENNSYLVDYSLGPVFGMPWCISTESLIKTSDGYVKAEYLEEGAKLYNKNLNNKTINKFEIRKINNVEHMLSFKYFSMPSCIEVTNNHKLYILDEDEKPIIKKASDINVGDYLVVPKPSLINKLQDYVENFKEYQMPDLCYLSGLYLAEGHVERRGYYVSFAFNINEKYTLGLKCKELMMALFNFEEDKIYERDLLDRNGYEIAFNRKDIAAFFLKYFGTGSKTKTIHYKFKFSNSNKWLLQGYWDGDGHIRKEGYKNKKLKQRRISPECVAETASFTLAMDLRDVMLSLNIIPSLRFSKRQDGRESYTSSVCDKEFDTILGIENTKRINSRHRKKFDSYFGVLVTKKEELEDYDGLVCSMSVDEDEDERNLKNGGSYILNGVASSNSPWYRGDQMWAEPNLEDAMAKMRYVYNNREEAKQKGLKLQKNIKENFSWEVIANKIVEEIKLI